MNRTGVLVNLIPFNPGSELQQQQDSPEAEDRLGAMAASSLARSVPHYKLFRRPSLEAVDAFQSTLRANGVWTSVRAARGDDEASACGQLATSRRPRNSNTNKALSDVGAVARVQTERLLESGESATRYRCLPCVRGYRGASCVGAVRLIRIRAGVEGLPPMPSNAARVAVWALFD